MTRLIGKGAARLIASLLIWLVFMIFLMTAVTQQSVSARVDRSALGLGYSGTLALVKDFKLRQMERPELLERQRQLFDQFVTAERIEEYAQGDYQDSWDAALPTLKSLSAKYPKCDITIEKGPVVTFGARAALWGQGKLCAEEHAKEQPAVSEGFSKSKFPELRRKALLASKALARAKKQYDEVTASLAKATDPGADEQKAIASFRDADVLRAFFLTRWLVDFPPPVLQLLLSASAGAFGALLITLILLVYPKTDLKFSTSSGFWERIMLGGFIAVCVYIVLLGGTAVLGTASFDQGGANYMTFCAISVLAGMFSDRVAHWLSQRADLFFKDEGAANSGRVSQEP
ncbi:MAG TPA: hypothetical protein VF535_15495 [Allosphingosinicella sp.]|jgi:hypothetical protein